jgi:hypothetical protein
LARFHLKHNIARNIKLEKQIDTLDFTYKYGSYYSSHTS